MHDIGICAISSETLNDDSVLTLMPNDVPIVMHTEPCIGLLKPSFLNRATIDDFYGVDTFQSADEYPPPPSWDQIPALKVETKIYHRIWDEKYDYTIKEAGKMKLYKLNKDVDVLGVSDSVSGDDSEVGVAIHNVLHPDWDEIGTDEMNEDVLYAGNPFIVFWFEIEEEYRKKRLGHSLLYIALQGSLSKKFSGAFESELNRCLYRDSNRAVKIFCARGFVLNGSWCQVVPQ